MRRAGVVSALAISGLMALFTTANAAGPGGWENVGGGLNDRVSALNSEQPGQLIVGGRFSDAGGNPAADRIAIWNGSAWSALGPADSLPGAASSVSAIAVFGGNVYAGGSFGDGAGAGPDNLAVFSGGSWQPFCASLSGPVDALQVVGSTLYVGGAFTNVNGNPGADGLIKCDLGSGAFVSGTVDGDADLDGRVQALTADGAGNVYAGGTFINLDGIPAADYVAKYDGASWSAMGSGLGGPPSAAIDTANVDALASDGTNVYIGADDDDIGGVPAADHVARWDGATWHAVGSSPTGDGYFPAGGLTVITDLLVDGSRLYATGSFQNAGGDPLADHVAAFDGVAWSHLGSDATGANGPFVGSGEALAMFAGAPVLGGSFVDAGGDPLADRLAAFPAATTPPPAPVAKLDKTPKNKVFTDDPKAKVRFKFSAEDGSTFLCHLDKKSPAACVSPKTVKAKPGKHKFTVQAVGPTGVAGEPVVDKFKVIRR